MVDMFSKKKRSEVMSRVRSANTGLEKYTKTVLRKARIKYRSQPKVFGNPDFLLENKTVLFCDSSFWHGKNWNKLKKKLENGNNSQYWVSHINKNRKRDKEVTKVLRDKEFVVIRLWDKDLHKRSEWCMSEIKKSLERAIN